MSPDSNEFLGTPVRRTDPSAGPSPKTITHRGIIQVIRQDNNAVYGYVSRTLLQTGISIIALDAVDALIVTFETDQTGSGSALNIAMEVRLDSLSISGSGFSCSPFDF